MTTASKWFVPEEEFLARTEDYAVVGYSATWVKNHLLDTYSADVDDVVNHPAMYGDIFGTEDGERLVYADVDRDNHEHQDITQDIAKGGFLAEDIDQETTKKLFDSLSIIHATHDIDIEDSAEDTQGKTKREQRAARLERTLKQTGYVSSRMIDYVLELEGEENRRKVLAVLSRQNLRKVQRPVMLLIGMIDKFSAGVREGWLIGYAFNTHNIIIKPYHADKTQHPLAEKWDVELPDDGISFRGRPSAFVSKLLEANAEIQKGYGDEDIKDPLLGFKLEVYYSAATWMVDHWKALASIEQVDGDIPMTYEGILALDDLIEHIPEVKHPKPYHMTAYQQEVWTSKLNTLQCMQKILEDNEVSVRWDALEAQRDGQEAVAQKVAKLYEELLEKLQQFNQDPENIFRVVG
ncbi:MAG: hypothetical protein Q9182_002036 [Xanthomendoza sp. 2 TL-2023]